MSIRISACEGCSIYILDVCAQVQIDDCIDCRVVVAPCTGSVFLRDCVGCTFSVAAKQLRLRNVLRSEVRVFVDQPEAFIVEASDRLKVGN